MEVNDKKTLDMDCYAVVGNPVEHSQSPFIHAAFAQQTQQKMHYGRVLAPLDAFEQTIASLITKGFKGVNVTVPFKFAAYRLCTRHSPQAHMAGAANTLVFLDGEISGYNTDGDGLVTDIKVNLQQPLKEKRILLLGAGGAAEGVFESILNEQPAILTIANRDIEKAERIVNKFSHHQIQSLACGFTDLNYQQFDIIINATSTGLSNVRLPIPDSIFANNALAYDMMYGRETPFMEQARLQGARVADGLGMLVEQAATAFYLWRHVKPDTRPVFAQLRQRLNN